MANSKDLTIVVKAKDEASTTLKKIGGQTDSMARSFGLGSISVLAIAGSVGYLGKQMINAAAKFEQTKVAFSNMLGSAEQANTLVKQLADFAVKTPFELKDLEEGAKRLLAYGTAAADIIPQMTMLGTAASLTGVPVNQLALAFGQVQVKGKLMGQEVLQFFNAGIPITKLLGESMGKTAGEISKMVEQGLIGFEDLNKVMEANYGTASKNGKLMEEQSKTFLGKVSNIKDSWDQFLRTQGQGLLIFANMAIEKLATILNWLRADAEGFNFVGKTIYGVSQFFAALAKTVWAVALVFGGFISTMIEAGKVGYALVKDMIANFTSLGTRLKNVFSAMGQALTGNFKEAGDSIKTAFGGALTNTVAQMSKFGEVQKDISFGVSEAFKAAGQKWVDFASLKGFESAKVKLGELPNAIAGTLGGGSGNAKEVKKIEDAFDKLRNKVTDTVSRINTSIGQSMDKLKDLKNQMNDLFVNKAKEDLGMKNDYASVYVEQEKKVAELKERVEKGGGDAYAVWQEYDKEKQALDSKKNIAIAYQKEIDEARRRSNLTGFELQLEELQIKQTIANQEFEMKKTQLLLEEKLTIESINREIGYYNALAKAISAARLGKTSNQISIESVQKKIDSIADQQSGKGKVTLNISNNTINGTGGIKELTDTIGKQLVNVLGLNTQLIY